MKTAHLRNKFRLQGHGGFIEPQSTTAVSLAEDCWMTTKEAAEYLRLGCKRLLNMSSNGQIPYHKLGSSNRYLKSELIAMLNKNRRGLEL